MIDPATNPVTDDGEPDGTAGAADAALVESDLIVEDVSIDGMCGVY
ncbi:MAG: mycofactocin precursor MftA [Acidimicrobiales bacterium]